MEIMTKKVRNNYWTIKNITQMKVSFNMKYSKKFKKSFNGFNPLFSASEYLKIKGNSCLNEDENLRVGISNDFDFMDTEEFQNITNELKVEFKNE